jgi:hypothetical protein
MGQLVVIAIVDTVALVNGNPMSECIYMYDNNKHVGSMNQGKPNLVTFVQSSQVLCWLATGLTYSLDAPQLEFVELCGEAVEQSIMVADRFDSPSNFSQGLWWGASVASNAADKVYNYTMKFKIGGQSELYEHTAQVRVQQPILTFPAG